MQESILLNNTLLELPPSNLPQLKELSNYLVETESTLSAFWLLSPAMKVIAKNGSFLKVNPSCKQYLGYEPEELIGKKYINFIHPDDVHNTLNIELNLAFGNTIRKFKNRYLHKQTKKWITLEWYARQDQHSGLVFATALDKTVETEQQEELVALAAINLKEKEKFKQALDLAPIGIFLTDNNGLCTYVNKKYLELTGLSVEECVGTGWEKGLCDSERDRVVNEWYSYIVKLKNSKELIPFETFSCYYNAITNKRTPVKIYAYFYDLEASIGYVTVIPYLQNADE